MTDNNKWLTVAEASKLSGYHPERIRELMRDKKIVAQKFSIVWQVSREVITFLSFRDAKIGGKAWAQTRKLISPNSHFYIIITVSYSISTLCNGRASALTLITP